MAIHRHQLPVVGPCDGFEPAPGSSGLGGFCTRCSKQVHDVSAMHESELRRFLAARKGTEVCLAYRFDDRGQIQLRPSPRLRAVAVAGLALLLAACAGHLGELQVPGEGCVDASGYQVACSDPSAMDMISVPEQSLAVTSSTALSEGQGCPVRPTASPTAEPGERTTVPMMPVVPAGDGPSSSVEPSGPGRPDAEGTGVKFRANFSVDPDERGMLRGVVVVGEWIDRDFVPTKQLWVEAEARRAQRRRWRRRLRAR